MTTLPDDADVTHAFDGFIDWLRARRWDDLPAAVRHRAVRVLADDLAAALSAAGEPEVARAHRLAAAGARSGPAAGGPADDPAGGPATLLAPGFPRIAVARAAVANGLAMGWNELDEGYRQAVCHAGLYVLPALLAVAEAERATLRDLLRALVLGYEAVTRIARAWRPATLTIHPHALLAPVGAAAGVGLLRGLPAAELTAALSTAATLGMVGPFDQALRGVLTRNTWAAQAAGAGLQAIEWAGCGIGGRAATLQSVYAKTLGIATDLTVLEPGDGRRWAIEDGYHKLNACCQYAHSAIEAVQKLLGERPALRGGDRVAAIEVDAHPLAFALDERAPSTTLGAKFSVPHAVAAAVVRGHGGATAFDAASLRDERIGRLRGKVTLRAFEGVGDWPRDRPARVRLIDVDGVVAEAECWSARGGPDRPYEDAQLWSKVAELTAPAAPRLAATLQAIDGCVEADRGEDLARPWADWLARGIGRADEKEQCA